MKIISHRGYWHKIEEKNSEVAFERSFSLSYGTETDVRDSNGDLVISHDIPTGGEIDFKSFLSKASIKSNGNLTIAINIKADGLASAIKSLVSGHPNLDCFAFDMSIPDMRDYIKQDIPVFTRMSEVEQAPIWLEESAGVWLDSFESEWYSNEIVQNLLNQGKRVCIVSPELHKRDHKAIWEKLKPLANEKNLILCTDFPESAKDFFELNELL